MTQPEETPVSFIPSNFIEKGKILNGTFDIRNAIESIVLSLAIGIPVFHLPLSLTARIIILCMTALPAAMVALIGIGGESITAFFDECPAFCSEPQGNLEVRQSSGRKATQETTFQRAKDKETPESRKNGRAFQSNGIGSPTV